MADEEESRWPLSTGKYAALVCAMTVSSFFSILGSTAILRIAHLKLSSAYQRFLYMLSISDILNSSFLLLHHYLVPKDEAYPWAAGNDKTCSMVGFFFHFGSLLISLYNCMLAVYFFNSIRSSRKKQKQPEDIIGWREYFAHFLCWVIAAGVAGAGAVTKTINFDTRIDLCVIIELCEPNEPGCVGDRDGLFITLPSAVIFYLNTGIICLASAISIMATTSVYCRVRSTFLRGREYGVDGELSDEIKQRLSAVMVQSLLYTLSYLNSFVWLVVAMTYPKSGSGNTYFAFQFLAFFFYPLQGVLNCFIYIRPRYEMLGVMYPNDSSFVVLRVALSKAGDPEEIENIRAYIYGEDYESQSYGSEQDSATTSLPGVVEFDPSRPCSITSMVSDKEDVEETFSQTLTDDDEKSR
jgi:hypothetical protein